MPNSPERPGDMTNATAGEAADDALMAEDLLAMLAPGETSVGRPLPVSRRPTPGSGASQTSDPVDIPGAGAGPVPIRTGRRFRPLPGALPTGGQVALVATAGTPIHAVESGTVSCPKGQSEPLRLHAESGMTFSYAGLASAALTVHDGERVAAGAILGTLAGLTSTVDLPVLSAVDRDGGQVDVADLLVGATDPNELGQATIGAGADIDPDSIDRAISRTVVEPPGTWGSTP
jgi:hypothetical protein